MTFPYPSVPDRLGWCSRPASPRRRELLGLLGVPFEVVPADVDETPLPDEDVDAMVRRLAAAKALAVDAGDDTIVIGADTAVEIDGEILGKPTGTDHAAACSGGCRVARTASTLPSPSPPGQRRRRGATASEVTFVAMSDAAIEWYVATGEPLDKAGAYGIQGIGGVFVETVRGA